MLDQEMLEQKLYKKMYKNLKEVEKYLVFDELDKKIVELRRNSIAEERL